MTLLMPPIAASPEFLKARDLVRAADRIAIVTHTRADGDAIGSLAALQHILRLEGKRAEGLLFEQPAPRYAFIAERENLRAWDDRHAEPLFNAADLWIIVDTAAAAQLPPLTQRLARRTARLIVIDHHRSRDIAGDINLIDEQAAAAALIVYDWFIAAGWALSPAAAEALFIGLATDTGWFRHANADARAFQTAAALMGYGVRPDELHRRLYQSEPAARFRLFAAAMHGLSLEAGGSLAVMEVTREMLARSGATSQLTEDLVNEPLRIGEVCASVLLTETDDGHVRVSFRAKGGIDVAAVAQRFGGGGHALASGATLNGPLAHARHRVIEAMTAAMSA